ncbi:L-aspartate oxidase [Kribbella sp. NPDC004536]|uniref:L-aspartate oxidase n=1 Tax=Kribbella sp. NPDC004536 TaxID=3364106 RepID=UPI003696242E
MTRAADLAVDVVVVGAGVAGLSAALGLAATRRVLVLGAGDGSTPWAQGGVAAAYGEDDPLEHAHDTQVAGAGFCDPRSVRTLVEEGPQRVAELIAHHARFDRQPDGSLSRTLEGGHSRPRIVHAGGDATGAELHRVLTAAVLAAGVETLAGRAVGLTKSSSGRITGVLVAAGGDQAGAAGAGGAGAGAAGASGAGAGAAGAGGAEAGAAGAGGAEAGAAEAGAAEAGGAHAPGEGAAGDGARGGLVRIGARAVVLATGGIGNAYLASTNPGAVRGDGIALALQAGASLVDMEFVQFHPTALFTGETRGQLPLVTEAVRGEGAVLRDVRGRRIMAGRHPRADLAPRDIVAREIEAAMRRDGSEHVWLDATSIAPDVLRRRFPTVLASCARIGVDLLSEQIPVAPAEHFLCGGVRVDRNGATDVPGLYAVGEVAATGVHGANRLASNSLLEGLVFGKRVATALTLDLPGSADGSSDDVLLTADREPERIRAILTKYAGIRRDGAGLSAAADELSALGNGPLATVARSVVAAATARQESRGCHWRSDHPHTDHRWDRHVSLTLDPRAHPVVTLTPSPHARQDLDLRAS